MDTAAARNCNSGIVSQDGNEQQDQQQVSFASALNFARSVSPPKISFGTCTREEVIKQLREIADRMENSGGDRAIVLQEAHSAQSVYREDFLLSTLVLHFAEFLPTAKKGTGLFGPAGFSVAVKS